MLTSAGKFDQAEYSGEFAGNQVGIYIEGKKKVRLEARHLMQRSDGIRVCSPVAVRASHDVTIIGIAENFSEAEFPLLSWDSNVNGSVQWSARNCTPDSDILPWMQLTGFGVDCNRVEQANSIGLIFDVKVKKLRLGPRARARYGEQSDGVNIQSQGFSGAKGRVVADTVGEAFDCFGDNTEVRVFAKRCYAYGVKLIHGASFNYIVATIHDTAGHGVVFGGSNSSKKSVSYNVVRAKVAGVGALGGFAHASAIGTDGTSALYRPEHNRTYVRTTNGGHLMQYAVFEESGSNNIYEVDGDGFAISMGEITSTAGKGNLIFRKNNSRLNACVDVEYVISSGEIIIFKKQLSRKSVDYNSESGIFIANKSGKYFIFCRINLIKSKSSEFISFYIMKNNVEISKYDAEIDEYCCSYLWVEGGATFDCREGDSISVKFYTQNAENYTIVPGPDFSFLYIEQE
ncbi:hypothetical protein [Sphingobium phenoxybenzoativorans]|uniref:hypothetical protein n=1 Tax=Sphingobium phenoxybenzoativorans TaxID=1592790 RepID=UPI001112FE2F|nr:hypothetical protein [Sphingobium phenoxybenzoativorans]